MKLYKLSFALLLGLGTLSSCSDDLNVQNPNQQSSGTFGNNASDLQETVIAAYNHIRMEGTNARVGYTIDLTRGDEVWNASQVWYMPFDDYDQPTTGDIDWWIWRDYLYTVNVCNFGLSKIGNTDDSQLSESYKQIKGQLLFLRGLSYYTLAGYFQNPPLITDYSQYSTLEGLYVSNAPDESKGETQFDVVFDQVEKDFAEAMTLLPSRDEGGEWAKGRATCGAAAGYYARALMMRHKYAEALDVLKKIINGDYGHYGLMANYGDNFREGPQYENNKESLFEVQYLDYGSQGTDDEWTPVNTSKNATQGHAVESNFGPGDNGGWADLSASPWLYNLFKSERTTDGHLDPRLYWTIGTYEADWDSNDKTLGNVAYQKKLTANSVYCTNNTYGGLPIAKWTNMRTGLYNSITTGLHCGINLRLMRYSDVLLRAAECENEVYGPDQQAIDWINEVRERAGLADLKLSDFDTKDKLFEQIANVERPKEFGCEFGRGFDLIRWSFYLTKDRQQQLMDHETFTRMTKANWDADKFNAWQRKALKHSDIGSAIDSAGVNMKCSFDTYQPGHEFEPIVQTLTNKNSNLVGNSANNSTSNASYFEKNGWTIHPVVSLGK